jgi:hypothetical protein
MKVYMDNDVVSALRRWDHSPQENDAIRQIKERSDADEIVVLVSKVHDREAARIPSPVHRREQEEILADWPKATFVEDQWLGGFNFFGSGGSLIVSPRHEEDPVTQRLWQIGLDRPDAHHIMIAIRYKCDVFVTCDERTILCHRDVLQAEFPPILFMLPSELVQRYPRASERD